MKIEIVQLLVMVVELTNLKINEKLNNSKTKMENEHNRDELFLPFLDAF